MCATHRNKQSMCRGIDARNSTAAQSIIMSTRATVPQPNMHSHSDMLQSERYGCMQNVYAWSFNAYMYS